MNEMIERVAIAMCKNGGPAGNHGGYCTLCAETKRCVGNGYRRQARVAIEAMREPTDAMKAVIVPAGTEFPMRAYWQAMIAEALK